MKKSGGIVTRTWRSFSDPCFTSGIGLALGSLQEGGLWGIAVNGVAVPTYFTMRFIREGRDSRKRAAMAFSPDMLHPGAFRALARNEVKAPAPLKTQAAFQVVLMAADYCHSGFSLTMIATTMLACGNVLESFPVEKRKAWAEKSVAFIFRGIRRPWVIPYTRTLQTAENMANAFAYAVFNSHTYWTIGLAALANKLGSGLCYVTGFGFTALRDLRPYLANALVRASDEATKRIAARYETAPQESAFRRAAKWVEKRIATAPTRTLQWLCDNKQSSLGCIAAGFVYGAGDEIYNGLVHGTSDWKLNAIKMVCYVAMSLSLISMERRQSRELLHLVADPAASEPTFCLNPPILTRPAPP